MSYLKCGHNGGFFAEKGEFLAKTI